MSFEVKLSESLQQIKGNKSNISSPFSILCALDVLRQGVQGRSKEILDSICVNLPSTYPGLANAIFYRRVNREFLEIYGEWHIEELRNLEQVNNWVAKATKNKIPELFDVIDPEADLIICNAIYFNQAWLRPFDEHKTADGQFIGPGNPLIQFMYQELHCNYMEKDNRVYLGLRYKDQTMFIARLGTEPESPEVLKELPRHHELVEVRIPKFKVRTKVSLKEFAQIIGLDPLFKVSSDFEPILGIEGCVGQFLQEAVMEVDEGGTVAAAATGIAVFGCAAPMRREVKRFNANVPFRYWIYDPLKTQVLFEGIFTGESS